MAGRGIGKSGFENTLKRMGLKPAGGQHALRSPAMRQGAIGASAVQSAQAGAGTPGVGTPGVPQLSDDPQTRAFAALVQQMLPGLNLPILNGGPGGMMPAPIAETPVGTPVMRREAAKVAEFLGTTPDAVMKGSEHAPQMQPGASFGMPMRVPGLPGGKSVPRRTPTSR